MSKKINTEPFNFIPCFKKAKNITIKYGLVLIAFLLFMGFLRISEHVFSNDYVFNQFIKNKGYSRKCLTIYEDEKLIDTINNFYKNSMDNKVVPSVFFNNIPKSLSHVKDIKLRKTVYVSILLPILLKIHKEVEKERQDLLHVSQKLLEVPLEEKDFLLIEILAKKYKVKLGGSDLWYYTQAMEDLMVKVDIIPISLSLAISAKETGWGESRFLKEGNSLFSQWVWSKELGILPAFRAKGATHFVRRFSSLEEAVRGYYMNLNVNASYQSFRDKRYQMRLADEVNLDSLRLARTLDKYSQQDDYTTSIVSIIRENRLERFDVAMEFSKNYNSVCLKVL